MGAHVTFSQKYPYYKEATKGAVEEWNSLQRNCLVDMNCVFNEKGIHLVPYPAQFSVPLFPENIKQSCLAELKERHEHVCLFKNLLVVLTKYNYRKTLHILKLLKNGFYNIFVLQCLTPFLSLIIKKFGL